MLVKTNYQDRMDFSVRPSHLAMTLQFKTILLDKLQSSNKGSHSMRTSIRYRCHEQNLY